MTNTNKGKNEMETKTIKVEIKTMYGTERIYPLTYVNEIASLTGAKTLSRRQIESLKAMGFSFEVANNVSV